MAVMSLYVFPCSLLKVNKGEALGGRETPELRHSSVWWTGVEGCWLLGVCRELKFCFSLTFVPAAINRMINVTI